VASFIAAVVGGVLSAVTLVGGVHAYQGDPQGVSADQLYTYGDN
jgi:hypothetical protein